MANCTNRGVYTFNSNATLTAEWKLDHYIIKYNANGGSDAPASQNRYPGKTITLRSGIPTRSGYAFRGWATSSSATVAKYQPGAKFNVDGFFTLYAVWERIPAERVELNANNLTLAIDSSHSLKATVYPKTASRTVTWSSDNSNVATVSSLGTVTVVGAGTATITATATDQKSAQCIITVPPDPEKVVKLSSANFPDSYFRNFLIDEYDSDGNNYLGEEEISRIKEIDKDDLPLNTQSLTGIKHLTSLTYLKCAFNKVTALDISGCVSIEQVYAAGGFLNQSTECDYLKSFRADGCPSLRLVDLWSTDNVTSMYINNCPSLNTVDLSNNKNINSISIKGCYALEILDIPAISVDLSDCYSLKYLNLSNYSATQYVGRLDIRNCPALVSLYYTGKMVNMYGDYIYTNENDRYNYMSVPNNTSIITNASLSILKQPVSVESEFNEKAAFITYATGKVITFQWQEQMDDEWVDIPNGNAMKLELMAYNNGAYRCKVTDLDGNSIFSDTATLTVQCPSFGTPDFVLPESLECIEASAFEGINAKVVVVPTSCTRIEDYAFRNSSV